MAEEPRIYNGERTVYSIYSFGKTGQPHAKKKCNWTLILYHTQQLTQNGLKTCKTWNHKTLEENIGSKLLDIIFVDDFFGFDTKSKGKTC